MRQGRLKKNQLGYLINYKQIEPINSASWKLDGRYSFKEGVQRLVDVF